MSKEELPTTPEEARFCRLVDILNPPFTDVFLTTANLPAEQDKVQIFGFVQGKRFRAKMFDGRKNFFLAQVVYDESGHIGYICQRDDGKWYFYEKTPKAT